MIIEVLDKAIKWLEVVSCVRECEVTTEVHKDLIALVHSELLIDPVSEQVGLFVTIEHFTRGVCNSGIIAAEAVIKPEDIGNEAVPRVRVGKDLG